MMTSDHIVAKAKSGPKENITNRQTMCRECNGLKSDHDISIEELRQVRAGLRPKPFSSSIGPTLAKTLERMLTVQAAIERGQDEHAPSYNVKRRLLEPMVARGWLKERFVVELSEDATSQGRKTHVHYELTDDGLRFIEEHRQWP